MLKQILTMILLMLVSFTAYAADGGDVEKQYERAQGLFEAEKYIEAVEGFQKIVDEHPKSEWADDALFMIGKSNEKIGAYCLSEYQFQRLPEKYTERYDIAKYKKYMNYIKEHRTDYRYFEPGGMHKYLGTAYKKLEQEYPESELADNALYQIISIKMVGDWEGGPEELSLALKLYETFFKKYPRSELINKTIFRINHSFPSPWFYSGKSYKEPLKMAKEMLTKYREILRYVEKDNNISEALLAIGEAYYKMKDYESAKQTLLELKKMYAEDKRAEPILKTIDQELWRESLLESKNREKQISILKKLLADPNPQIREYAIEKIAELKEPSFIPFLLKLYMDAEKEKNWELRNKIGWSLKEIGIRGEEQFARLIKTTKDKTTKIRLARICRNMKSEKINQASIQLLKKEKDPQVKMAFLELLTHTGDPTALPVYLHV